MPKTAKKDGGWGWVVVGGGCVIYLIVFGLLRCQSVLFVHIVNEFDSDFSTVAWVSSIATGTFSFAGVFAAPLIDKFGHRPTAMAGGLIAAIGYIGAFLAPNLIVLIVTAGCITGVGMSVAFVATPVIIGHYFEKRRSLAINIASIGASLGTLSICPLNEWLTESYGLQGYFLIFSGVLLNVCVAGMLMRPPPKDQVPDAPRTRVSEFEPPDEESSLVGKKHPEITCRPTCDIACALAARSSAMKHRPQIIEACSPKPSILLCLNAGKSCPRRMKPVVYRGDSPNI